MKRWVLMTGVGLLGLLLSMPSVNAAIVSVDVDPGTPGIQNMINVVLGNPVAVDVVVSDILADDPLNAFEFDLDFISSIVNPTSVMDGGFLLAPRFVDELNLAQPDVNFAEQTLSSAGAIGDGVLASIVFDTVGFGMSGLTLNDVILSAPFGMQISPVTLENGKITVAPVPVPASLPLLLSGLAVLIGVRRFGKRGSVR